MIAHFDSCDPSPLVQNVNSTKPQRQAVVLSLRCSFCAIMAQLLLLVLWAMPTSLSVVLDEMLYLPALTTTLLNNKFVIAAISLRNFQASLCFSVLDRSILEI